MKPYLHTTGRLAHFQWNLECSVGKAGQNTIAADVSYLQWYYTLAVSFPETPADRAAIYRGVAITGKCTGKDDDPLVQSIFAQQRGLNHPIIDGKASVAPEGGRIGETAYFILRLNARLATQFPNQWPRLDLIRNCPPAVAQAVLSAIPKVT
jgi:hypothetical protein